jgi:hypothetical protein
MGRPGRLHGTGVDRVGYESAAMAAAEPRGDARSVIDDKGASAEEAQGCDGNGVGSVGSDGEVSLGCEATADDRMGCAGWGRIGVGLNADEQGRTAAVDTNGVALFGRRGIGTDWPQRRGGDRTGRVLVVSALAALHWKWTDFKGPQRGRRAAQAGKRGVAKGGG